jgi:DNA-binding transcriptional MocR family regulator
VRHGSLYPGMRLPSERHLARLLGVSRTTVVASYNDLRAGAWLESRVGSGTWLAKRKASLVRASIHAAMVARSPVFNMLQASETSAIDFATTTPYPLRELIEPVLPGIAGHASALLDERAYMSVGLPALRETVARYCTATGTPTTAEEVVITTGGQQAISLVCALLLQPGDYALVESPTFYGALEAFRVAGARLAALPVGKDHVSPRVLEQRVSTISPRLIYLTPTGQNPTGAVMPDAVRAEIARGSLEHGVTIVEDEVLADVFFGGQRPRPIASFVPNANVLTVGSLSKVFWPSLRVGWIRGPRPLIGRLARLKTAHDLGSALLPQILATELFELFPEARRLRRREFLRKRDLAARLVRELLPGVSFAQPQAGLCLWISIPAGDSQLLAQTALRHGLVLSHGNLFSVDESHGNYVRLPFVLEDEVLERGIRILAQAYAELTIATRSAPEPVTALT